MILRRLLTEIIFVCICIGGNSIIHLQQPTNEIHHTKLNFNTTINKVILTQRGYIQFLKYYVEVKPITEYTFCIWINSDNLTHSHPLLSYSKNEEERLISVWITPGGQKIKAEILGVHVFSVPVGFVENQWYHVCQSWSSNNAAWNLFIDGHLFSKGHSPELKGRIIKGEGDLVVGQEYTDFDKGLDDGIEGAIYGFNLVLSPSFSHNDLEVTSNDFDDGLQILYDRKKRENTIFGLPVTTSNLHKPNVFQDSGDNEESDEFELDSDGVPGYGLRTNKKSNAMRSHINFNKVPIYNDKIFKMPLIESSKIVSQALTPVKFESNLQKSRFPAIQARQETFTVHDAVPISYKNKYEKKTTNRFSSKDTFLDAINKFTPSKIGYGEVKKPLGLLLVELSYDCSYRKGAPLDGPKVLINWAKTPVRVFGGALLKSIPPFCK